MKNLTKFLIFTIATIYLSTEGSPLHEQRKILSYFESIIYRELWGAPWISDTIPRFTSNVGLPCVVIHDIGNHACYCLIDCIYYVSLILQLQMNDGDLNDISYNFLIGSDGNIYEGRGWYMRPDYLDEFSDQCISIAAIGHFECETPNSSILRAFEKVLDFGEVIGYLHSNYSIVAHRQLSNPTVMETAFPSKCPGKKFYEAIQSIPRWNNSTITKNYDFYKALNREF